MSRSRTWPTTGGGHSSPSSASPVVCSDIRTCTRARRGAPIDESEFSPAASRIGASSATSAAPCRADSSGPSARSRTRSWGRRGSRRRSPTRRTSRDARAARDRRRTRGTSACRRRAPPWRCGRRGGRTRRRIGPAGSTPSRVRPTKLRSNWRAMRWTEWPSGMERTQPASGSNELSSAASTSGPPDDARGDRARARRRPRTPRSGRSGGRGAPRARTASR